MVQLFGSRVPRGELMRQSAPVLEAEKSSRRLARWLARRQHWNEVIYPFPFRCEELGRPLLRTGVSSWLRGQVTSQAAPVSA